MKKIIILLLIFSSTIFAQDYANEESSFIKKEKHLIDRNLLKRKLNNIFGEDVNPLINKMIFKSISDFGGPCDVYDQVFISETKVLNEELRCVGGKKGSRFPMYGKDSNLRYSYLVNFCLSAVENEKYNSKVMKQFRKLDNSQVISKAYELFYTFKKDEKLKSNVNNALKDTKDKETLIQKAIFMFCSSEGWQIY